MRRIKAMAILAVLAMCGAAHAASISGEVTVIPERYACMTVTDVEPTTISEADGIALAQELAKQNSVAQAQIVFYKPGTKVGDGIAAVAWTFGDEKIFRLSKDAEEAARMEKVIGCDIQPKDLWDAYDSNEVVADEDFRGKPVGFKATIPGVSKDPFDKPYIKIPVDGTGLFGIQVYLDKSDPVLRKLRKGMTVIVQARPRKFVMRSVIADGTVTIPQAKKK